MNYIIYHEVKKGTACPDGIMAAAIAKMAIPDAVLVGDSYRHESEYGDRPYVDGLPIIEQGDRLVIVDFSYPSAWLHYWESLGCSLTVIDHHAPKFPQLEGFSGAILDADECGATLTWRHFFPDRPQPGILRHVRRRDIGADGYYAAPENCRDSKAITAAMSSIRGQKSDGILAPSVAKQIEYCQYWISLPATGIKSIEDLRATGEGILKREEKKVAKIAAQAFPAFLCDHLCGKVQTSPETDRLASQIGNAIALAHPEWQFAWIVSADGMGNSLRSSNGFDVSEVAQQMGGGGHRAAAGFQTKN
jgi:uncharacterized protein